MEEQVRKPDNILMSFSCREGSCDGNCHNTVKPWVSQVEYHVCHHVPLSEIKHDDITKDFKLSSACMEIEFRKYLEKMQQAE